MSVSPGQVTCHVKRRCREPECPTLLSSYNVNDACSIHERENPPRNVDGTWTGRMSSRRRYPLVISWPAGSDIVECPVCQRASGGHKALRHHISRSHGRKVTYVDGDE